MQKTKKNLFGKVWMNGARIILLSVGVILICLGAYLAFHYLIPIMMSALGVSIDTPVNQLGSKVVLVMLVPLVAMLAGAAVGWLCMPLICRPFVKPDAFWDWMRKERSVTIPGYTKLFVAIASAIYGPSDKRK